MIRMLLPALLPVLLHAAPAAAQTAKFQDTEMLDSAVAQFTGKPIGEEGGARAAIDERLKLAPCPMPQFDWRGSFHDAVVVRCMAPAWRIYVPLNVTAPPDRSAAGPDAKAPEAVDVVKRNDPVTVQAGGAGFSITRNGIAMDDAPAGGRLRVRVERTEPPIQAVAVEPGLVRLPGWAD
ncbi:flagella basal body P-ring formation protein FlgA [Stakelama saccharophila]|uniref:Flagella basal body P-ring formation protein FlgA n=1 Tax=Stakelama saccharophila TaxID=3075605 RepID=A0ABZ0BAH8_9SPHN|nr:flagella basal body P-ring formation protein FlgA [Stakelama sp. W311]WNO53681.1 flagella basal body P-ring formation protein FlgA [Stakelama sp. W311]